MNYHSPAQRKEACLDTYVHHHPYPSWWQAALILRHRFKLHQQADLVENTYYYWMRSLIEKTQKCFDEAMMAGEVWIRNSSDLFLGPGGSGKTCLLAAILEEDPPSIRESTPCAKKPVRAVTHCKVGVNDNCFVRITDDQYSDMLVVTAEHFDAESNTITAKPMAQ